MVLVVVVSIGVGGVISRGGGVLLLLLLLQPHLAVDVPSLVVVAALVCCWCAPAATVQ